MNKPVPSPPNASSRRSLRLFAVGAAVGLAAAAVGILESAPDSSLPDGVVARIGAATIRLEEYERLLAGVESSRREPADAALRRHVLDRMIDEELLVQRAIELGLVEVDRSIRANLTSAMISLVVADAEDETPTLESLRAFYRKSADFFTRPGRLRVRQVFFHTARTEGPSDDRRPAQARDRLRAGELISSVRDALGDTEISPVPDLLLPSRKLREYLGPSAVQAALDLEVGGVSDPVRSGTGIHVLQLVEREPAYAPPFEDIRDQVEHEWRRQLGDRSLRAYLDSLREDANVLSRLPLADHR